MNVAGSEQHCSFRQAILRAMLLMVLLAAAGGCGYRVVESDGVATIRFQASTIAAVIVGGVVAIVVAAVVVYVRGIENPKATLIIGGTVLFVVALVPGIVMDTVTVGPDGVTQRTGFWFAPTVKGFRFDEVSELSIERRQVKRAAGRIRGTSGCCASATGRRRRSTPATCGSRPRRTSSGRCASAGSG